VIFFPEFLYEKQKFSPKPSICQTPRL